MTPAPSNGPQSSTVTCGQSRIEVSLPIHWTLSIPKVSATGPNQDCTVAPPEEYPSILSSFLETTNQKNDELLVPERLFNKPAHYKSILVIVSIITDRKAIDKDVPFVRSRPAHQCDLYNG